MYNSTTTGRGTDSPNPFSTNNSPPNSFDSRDPFETASSRNHPNFYRDADYSEMGDAQHREPNLESEAALVERQRSDSYATTQAGGYDPYHVQTLAQNVSLPSRGSPNLDQTLIPNFFPSQLFTGGHSRRDTDVESMVGGGFYDRGATPSAESLRDFNSRPDSQASIPTFDYVSGSVGYEIYPAWVNARGCPISKEEIEDIFHDLTQKFGFQRDNMRNQFDFLMQALDSRASRMAAEQALLTLHADYIGGEHANYRKWYFAAQLDLDDAVGASQSQGLNRLKSLRGKPAGTKVNGDKSLAGAQARWRQVMQSMSHYDRLRQVALYLLCWGEAAQVRFVPECLCFIF
ncbi:1,3-beta-D-glucan synthase, partial [Tulasnella sp. 427]